MPPFDSEPEEEVELVEDPADELQYELSEPVTPVIPVRVARPAVGAPVCMACGRPIQSTYFALGDKTVCPDCRASVDAPPPGSRMGRLGKATLFGIGAGLLGAAVWFAVRKLAGMEIGYIALLVGFLVGKAVRKGSGGRGGRRYQVLAVVITYCCIAVNYAPDVLEALVKKVRQDQSQTAAVPATPSAGTKTLRSPANPAAAPSARPGKPPVGPLKLIGAVVIVAGAVFALSLAAPFFAGFQNIIGLLIIGFALLEAWKLTGRRVLPFTGPYRVAAG